MLLNKKRRISQLKIIDIFYKFRLYLESVKIINKNKADYVKIHRVLICDCVKRFTFIIDCRSIEQWSCNAVILMQQR